MPARELMTRGAVWKGFLFVANGGALLELYERRLPAPLAAFLATFASGPAGRWSRLAKLYENLATSDFSREVLQGNERRTRREPRLGRARRPVADRAHGAVLPRAGRLARLMARFGDPARAALEPVLECALAGRSALDVEA